jgi:hypothetical protein
MTTNATLNPNTLTEGGLPAVLSTISDLDPYFDLEVLLDIAYCVGVKLNTWMYDFDKVQRAILVRSLNAGFEEDGLNCHISIAMTEGLHAGYHRAVS